MNRKDTIIIAVLINAGLLALLFMMAINVDEEVIINQPVAASALVDNQAIPIALPSQSIVSQPLPVTSSKKILADAGSVDEMDNFLKELSVSDLSPSAFIDDEGMVDFDHEFVQASSVERSEGVNTAADVHIVEITVKRGDALEKIARNNGTTVEMIKKINHLSSSKLNIGQVLRIPVPVANVAAGIKQPSKQQPLVVANVSQPLDSQPQGASEAQYYTIKSGDNPWKIAKQYQVKYDDILKMNGIDEEKARNLKVGDKIRVK